MRKILRWVSLRFFGVEGAFQLSVASCCGLFLGMLPIIGIRIPLIILCSLVFNLNIIAVIAGMAVTIVFPILHVASFYIGQHLAGYQTPFFNLRYLYFSHLLHWTESSQYHFLGSIISGIILSLIAFPIFKILYSWRSNTIGDGNTKKYVFYDSAGRRKGSLKRFTAIYLIILIVIIVIFGASLSISPFLPSLGLRSIKTLSRITSVPVMLNKNSNSNFLKKEEREYATFQLDFKRHHKSVASKNTQNKKVFAFYVDWDENSFVSLKRNIKDINVVIPNWYTLNNDLSIKTEKDMIDKVDGLARGNNIKEMPLINNYSGDKWDGQLVHRIISSKEQSNIFITNILKIIKLHKYLGVNIDFESIDSKDKNLMTAFITELSDAFHSNGLQVSIDVPASDEAFDYKKLSKAVDYMVVMMYDQHYETGLPGPIASDSWFQDTLDNLDIPEDKLVVSLGSYGYDWTLHSHDSADPVTFGDIIEMVNSYKLQINWDDDEDNPYIRYKDGDDQHVIWLLDGATFYNQMKAASENGVSGIALWRLGSEDPSIWHLLKNIDNVRNSVNGLNKLTSPEPVHYYGEGEILRIMSRGNYGKRTIKLDKDGQIIDETYNSYPIPFEVERYGKPKSKEVVLTFDDGPDPVYTPQILDILKKNKIKADFFVVGENGEANPDIIEREYREGHEIGNHTFTHPNVADISPSRTKMELNTTERLVQELTGHSMVMFRPPYVADAEPSTPNELLPIMKAQMAGYTMVGELIDPSDWEEPPTKEILRRVLQDLPSGNIILLHDAGGNRANTVKALPMIIKTLKDKGYKFVTVSSLIGKTRNDVMPDVTSDDNPLLIYDKAVFTMLFDWITFIKYLFYLAIGVGIFRLIFLMYFSFKQRRRYHNKLIDKDYNPFVSVVIAAYNEENVIVKTINSILKSDYPNLEVIVVNDGSTDETSRAVVESFENNPKVRLINKENGGKSSAVNTGFKESKGEIVVALDADTVIAKDAISLMIRHFVQKDVGAVSGNVKVGNVHNLLTLWQHVEYVTGFNLERRAFGELNCITVVPGAIGAWRREAVIKAGYFKDDTLAEDTDITLSLLENGYKILFEEFAYAYTESPGDIKSLLKQRYRWAYGTLQCLWKHKETLFSRKYKSLGFIGLPNMWLFQYVFQSLSPLADIYFVIGLFGKSTMKVLIFYLVFLLIDYIASIYAFRLEKENKRPLILLFLQRIVYRQFMTYVVIKSVISAFTGIAVGWNKLQRKGNVETDI